MKCSLANKITFKLTTEEWIKRAKEVHQDKYDYSKTKYINADTKLTIVCKNHGEFSQLPYHHINGHGCRQCAFESPAYMKFSDTDSFVEKAIEIHGDAFDYSRTEYVDQKTELIIVCKDHGEFKQSPTIHLTTTYACPGCIKLHKNRLTDPITGDDFVRRAMESHGGKYGYPEVKYIDYKPPVHIECKPHGPFEIIPTFHLRGEGCLTCAKLHQYSNFEFALKAKEIHGDKYDYYFIKYVDIKTNIVVICKAHGSFEIMPLDFLSGAGCESCTSNTVFSKLTMDNKTFIERAKVIHGDKYDYSEAKYRRSDEHITIICPIHGEFLQTPCNHLLGKGCKQCGTITSTIAKTKTREEFIKQAEEIHGKIYDYSLVVYENGGTEVSIICPKPDHGLFIQKADGHINGRGCYKCGRIAAREKITKTREEFIEQAEETHGKIYDYSQVVYVTTHTKVIIICPGPNHGPFLQTPHHHIDGSGCPNCHISRLEELCRVALTELGLSFERQKKFDDCCDKLPLPFDFFIPSFRILIELDGQQHFEIVCFSKDEPSDLKLQQSHNNTKTNYSRNNNYHLLRISYSQLKNVKSS